MVWDRTYGSSDGTYLPMLDQIRDVSQLQRTLRFNTYVSIVACLGQESRLNTSSTSNCPQTPSFALPLSRHWASQSVTEKLSELPKPTNRSPSPHVP